MKKESIQFWMNVAVCAALVLGGIVYLSTRISDDRRVMLSEAGDAMRDITVEAFSSYYGFASYKVIDRFKQEALSNYADWCMRVHRVNILGPVEKDRMTNKSTLGSFLWPLDNSRELPVRKFTSYFGNRRDPFRRMSHTGGPRFGFHSGVDLVAKEGAPVFASSSGRVVQAGWLGDYGRCVTLDHGAGVRTRYGHQSRILVRKGQEVLQGQEIGKVGHTGRSKGAHLHFEVIINDMPVDPLEYM